VPLVMAPSELARYCIFEDRMRLLLVGGGRLESSRGDGTFTSFGVVGGGTWWPRLGGSSDHTGIIDDPSSPPSLSEV